MREHFGEGFEERSTVGHFDAFGDVERGFEYAGSGFGVEAFEWEVHFVAEVQEIVVELGVDGIADDGVSEESGGDRLHVAVAFFAHGVGVFFEEEEFEFECAVSGEAHIFGAVEYATQGGAGADDFSFAGEFSEHEQGVFFEGNFAGGFGEDANVGVGVGSVPAGECGFIVELIVAVPAEDDVAEAEAAVEGFEEFFVVHVFAAQDAVDIEHAGFDVFNLAGEDLLFEFGGVELVVV